MLMWFWLKQGFSVPNCYSCKALKIKNLHYKEQVAFLWGASKTGLPLPRYLRKRGVPFQPLHSNGRRQATWPQKDNSTSCPQPSLESQPAEDSASVHGPSPHLCTLGKRPKLCPSHAIQAHPSPSAGEAAWPALSFLVMKGLPLFSFFNRVTAGLREVDFSPRLHLPFI